MNDEYERSAVDANGDSDEFHNLKSTLRHFEAKELTLSELGTACYRDVPVILADA